ncbi:Gfo/Idh/MocA family oxidoreductase [Cellvibrio sp. NN19]|uniref:Gfo/Idh/MocA family protein n=1 Tax=Cellvibrio chitinivorans TaxID=3102792 RepID=UPI002B40BDBB|nr:Gfo/Idh/MocA family oxidoreductase [Cellvibrio sp. NN19]
MSNPIRIGFIGLNPDSHWAAIAHIPALKSLGDLFEIVGVANSTPESAQKTAQTLGLKHAFETPQALVQSDEIDLVVVTVKVPYHFELISAAINAGKHVHSEWPLGNGLDEARKLTALAQEKGIVASCGTQMRAAPEVAYLKSLIAEGYIGDVLSTSLIGSGGNWGAECIQEHAYLYDNANGATMLEIPFAHTLAGIKEVLGDFGDLYGKLIRRRNTVKVSETGNEIPRTDFDQIMVHGAMKSGAAFSAHYRGGMFKGTNLLWEINGTQGDLQINGNIGHGQFAQLEIKGAKATDNALTVLEVPAEYKTGRQKGRLRAMLPGYIPQSQKIY